jgi:hypothetical protein
MRRTDYQGRAIGNWKRAGPTQDLTYLLGQREALKVYIYIYKYLVMRYACLYAESLIAGGSLGDYNRREWYGCCVNEER